MPGVSNSVHILIEGRVQGVGFRSWLDLTARGLGLDGWVRNRRDGAVEAVLGGRAEVVEDMLVRCRRGPAAARVDRLEIIARGVEAPVGFEVRPTV